MNIKCGTVQEDFAGYHIDLDSATARASRQSNNQARHCGRALFPHTGINSMSMQKCVHCLVVSIIN
jgi:hypothetical protein